MFALLISLLSGTIVLAAEQRPPLTVNPAEKCHIADASPLLDKSQYQKANYQLTTLNKIPLTLQESIQTENALLTIEQRGCEDIYFKFNFKEKSMQSAAKILKQLKLLFASWTSPQNA